jgi:surfactin synthase thioesterase subunit
MIRNPAWWVTFFPRPKTVYLRLFCFPYAGGGASVFRKWPETFVKYGIEICAVQPPGRESRISERPLKSLFSLVHAMAAGLASSFDVPFAFFGHSMGALICFELARTLHLAGCQLPEHLFVSGARAPHVPCVERRLHLQADNEFIRQVADRYGGLSPAVLAEQELIDLLLPALKADFTAYETYEYREGSPLAVPITSFGGRSDPLVRQAELEAWRRHTDRHFTLKLFNGDHFFLNTERGAVIESILGQLKLFARERNLGQN